MNISFQNKKLTCLQADVLVNIFVSCVTDFFIKTVSASYSYQDDAMFVRNATKLIESIVMIDYRITQKKAIEVARLLELYWESNNASMQKLASKVKSELESCSPSEYNTLKAQLFSKQ